MIDEEIMVKLPAVLELIERGGRIATARYAAARAATAADRAQDRELTRHRLWRDEQIQRWRAGLSYTPWQGRRWAPVDWRFDRIELLLPAPRGDRGEV